MDSGKSNDCNDVSDVSIETHGHTTVIAIIHYDDCTSCIVLVHSNFHKSVVITTRQLFSRKQQG